MHWQYNNSLRGHMFSDVFTENSRDVFRQILRKSYNIYLVTFPFHLKKKNCFVRFTREKTSQSNFFCQNLRRQNNYIVKNNKLYNSF